MKKQPKHILSNRRRSALAALGVVGVFALTGVSAIYFSQAAAVNQPQQATLSPSDEALKKQSLSSQSTLVDLMQDVKKAKGYVYRATDGAGRGLDAAKIIDNPTGGYLAVYQSGNIVKVATSADVLKWTFKADLDLQGSQPTIMASSDGGFIVAYEYSPEPGKTYSQIRVAHYTSLNDLYAAKANKVFTAPPSLTKCSEGAPNIYSAQLNPDINTSLISIGMHYSHDCDTDRQAVGRLTNFTTWTASPHPDLTLALTKGAKSAGVTVKGNIGDRDSINLENTVFNLHEVQYVKGNPASWRPYLVNSRTGEAKLLKIKTHSGSTSLASPSFSIVKAPKSAGQALVVSFYVLSEGKGETGQLIYYKEL